MLLISGATGFVGRHLVVAFLQSQQSIIALYRTEEKKKETQLFLERNSLTSFQLSLLQWRQANLNDWESLDVAFKGATKVFHCAALVSLYPGSEDQMMAVNVVGTQQMLHLAQKNNIRWFGYISSIAALGQSSAGNVIDSKSLWNKEELHTAYAYTKQLAELEVWKAMQEGLQAAILNPGVVLGLGHPNSPLEQLLLQAKRKKIPVSPGSTGFVSILDVTQAALKIFEKAAHKKRFILVSENWTYLECFEQLTKRLPNRSQIKKISESQLRWIYQIERILGLLGRKRKLSLPLINSLCSRSVYDGQDIVKTYKNFQYVSLESELDRWLKEQA